MGLSRGATGKGTPKAGEYAVTTLDWHVVNLVVMSKWDCIQAIHSNNIYVNRQT